MRSMGLVFLQKRSGSSDRQRAEAADAAGELSLERALEVAPRLYCEQGVGRDEHDCGYGGYISFNEHNLSKGSDIASHAGL